jgi:hypothetical protein
MTIRTATPLMYPTSTGRDSSSARNPRRAAQATRQNRPTRPARAAARAAYRSGCPAAMPPSAVAVISAVVDSGPTEGCGDEPNTAYTIKAATRPKTYDRGQSGHFCIRHHLRNEVCRDGHAGQHVTSQPASLVIPHQADSGKEPLPSRARVTGRARRHAANLGLTRWKSPAAPHQRFISSSDLVETGDRPALPAVEHSRLRRRDARDLSPEAC